MAATHPRSSTVLPIRRLPAASATSTTSSMPAPSTATSTSPGSAAEQRTTPGPTSPPASTARPSSEIITDPTRGSHDAYAVTQQGVYYMANSISPSADLAKHHGQPLQPHRSALRQVSTTAQHGPELPELDPGRLALCDPVQFHERRARARTRCSTSRVTAASSGRSTTARPGPSSPTSRSTVPRPTAAISRTSTSPT